MNKVEWMHTNVKNFYIVSTAVAGYELDQNNKSVIQPWLLF